MYLLDPQQGRRRRHVAADRALKLLRRRSREAERRGRHMAQSAAGKVREAASSPQPPAGGEPDDVTLARTVESRIFRDGHASKGSVVVNVEHGVVYLRGSTADEGEARRLAESAREVPGVIDVRSLLHSPGTPAPSIEDVREHAEA
jgi:osmotically-inducible protein OsmY